MVMPLKAPQRILATCQAAPASSTRCWLGGSWATEVAAGDSPVAGDADILLMPDIEAANVFYKTLAYLTDAKIAGLITGARVPIVLTSLFCGLTAGVVMHRADFCVAGSFRDKALDPSRRWEQCKFHAPYPRPSSGSIILQVSESEHFL